MKLSAAEKEYSLEAVLDLSCDDLGSEKDQKIAQSTHENGYIKPRKTFWRNSKQLLRKQKQVLGKLKDPQLHILVFSCIFQLFLITCL